VYQAVVHVGTDALAEGASPASVSAETPAPDLGNLLSLRKYHHMVVHEPGYLIAATPGGGFTFYRPDHTPLPTSPALPPPEGSIEDAHDAEITAETIIPPWYGERLDLDHAIYVCFANARTGEESGPAVAGRPGTSPGASVPAAQMDQRPQRHGQLLPPLLRRTPGRLIIPDSTIASPFSRLLRTELGLENQAILGELPLSG
jgi:hypothetical protein